MPESYDNNLSPQTRLAQHEAQTRRMSGSSIARPSVCLSSVVYLSVTFVHATQAIEIFGNVSTPFDTLAIYDL